MVPVRGGESSVRVKTDPDCNWTASTRDSWIKLATVSGVGDGEVGYTVDQNTGPERQGTITIGGQAHRIDQQGAR